MFRNQKAVNPSQGVTASQKEDVSMTNYTTLFSPLSIPAPVTTAEPGCDTPPSKKKPVSIGRPASRADRHKGQSPCKQTERITVEIVIESSPMGVYDLSRILRKAGPRLWLKHYLGEAIRYVITQATGRRWTFKVVEGRVRQ